MDRDGRIELGLGRAHGDGNAERLDHFARGRADDVNAQHLVRFRMHDELHEGLFLAARQRALHGAEARLVDIDLAMGLAGLRLGQADRAQLRLGENGGRDDRVVDRERLVRIDGFGKGLAFADRNRRQRRPVRHIAHCVDALDIGLRIFVDQNLAIVAELHPCPVEAQPLGLRHAARGIHHRIGVDRVAIGELQVKLAIVLLLDRRDVAIHTQVDALLAHFLGQRVAQIVVETAHEERPAIELRHFHAEPVEDARELDSDISAASDHDTLGQFFQMEGFVGADRIFDAGNIRQVGRGADGDQNALRRHVAVFAREINGVRILQHGAAFDDLHARIVQIADVDTVQPVDFAILVGKQRLPVETRLADLPAEARRFLELLGKMAGIDEELLRYAATNDAGAANAIFLGHRHFRAMAGGHTAGTYTTGAGSDHKEVIVILRHQPLPVA